VSVTTHARTIHELGAFAHRRLARRLRALSQAAASDQRALDAELAAAIDSALARFEDDEAAHADLVTAVLERLGGSVPPVREALRPRPPAAPTITFRAKGRLSRNDFAARSVSRSPRTCAIDGNRLRATSSVSSSS
jgi:hypothetical protein